MVTVDLAGGNVTEEQLTLKSVNSKQHLFHEIYGQFGSTSIFPLTAVHLTVFCSHLYILQGLVNVRWLGRINLSSSSLYSLPFS